ncbi:alpha/beta fold hydrolase [Rhodococcoides yunnanense]|uniref:alpha/beta fold hydrolase n=1 Tax=Rhodococcoides yunnanense TaxID=278209 RepID=UPI000933C0E4|nr:alpha/beta hydrolase [Rhodococcus yunnanensis]
MSTFTTSDGAVLDVRDTGPVESGRVLVMLHGWSQSRAMFDRVIPLLAPSARVISFDQRGHGESSKPATGARIARLAADLHELLEYLGVETATFLGHSMGVSVLWSYLDSHGSSKFEKFVIVDQPSACAVLPWMTPKDAQEAGAILDFEGAAQFASAVAGPDGPTARHAFLVSMLTPNIPADDLEWMYNENLKLPAAWGARLLFDHIMQDWRDILPTIDVPTLVIAGEVSHVAPESQVWTKDHITGAQFRKFTEAEGGAHFPFFENPAPFAESIIGFISDPKLAAPEQISRPNSLSV